MFYEPLPKRQHLPRSLLPSPAIEVSKDENPINIPYSDCSGTNTVQTFGNDDRGSQNTIANVQGLT